jgi:hypothetical protein
MSNSKIFGLRRFDFTAGSFLLGIYVPFDFQLKIGKCSPSAFRRMANAVLIESSTLEEMPRFCVGLIGALAPRPMQWLARVVLLVAYERHVGNSHESVREVVEDARTEWMLLAFSSGVLPEVWGFRYFRVRLWCA